MDRGRRARPTGACPATTAARSAAAATIRRGHAAAAGARRADRGHGARRPAGHGRDRLPLPQAAVRRRSRRQPHPDQRHRRQPPHPSLPPLSTARLDLPDGIEVCNMAVDFDKWSLSSPRSCARPTGSCRRASRSTSAPASSCWCRRTSSTSARWRPRARARCVMNLQRRRPGHDHRPCRRAVRPGPRRRRAAADQPDAVRRVRVPQGDQPDRRDRPLPLPRPPLHHLSSGTTATARRGDLPPRRLRRSALPRVRSAAPDRRAATASSGSATGRTRTTSTTSSARSPTSTSTATCSPSTIRPSTLHESITCVKRRRLGHDGTHRRVIRISVVPIVGRIRRSSACCHLLRGTPLGEETAHGHRLRALRRLHRPRPRQRL